MRTKSKVLNADTIGGRVRLARVHIKYSQGKLAAIVGITQPTISDLERGDSDSTKHIVSIAKALGVSASWLETGNVTIAGGENHITESKVSTEWLMTGRSPKMLTNAQQEELEKIRNIASWVREARKYGSFNQTQLGDHLLRTKQTISAIESGKHQPSMQQILEINRLTGYPLPFNFNISSQATSLKSASIEEIAEEINARGETAFTLLVNAYINILKK